MADWGWLTSGWFKPKGRDPRTIPVVSTPGIPYPDDIRVLFDPETEKMYDARCGRQLEPLGHMFARFMMCPVHGEFTISPTVMFNGKDEINPEGDDKWYIHMDETMEGMWETCKYVDANPGTGTRVG